MISMETQIRAILDENVTLMRFFNTRIVDPKDMVVTFFVFSFAHFILIFFSRKYLLSSLNFDPSEAPMMIGPLRIQLFQGTAHFTRPTEHSLVGVMPARSNTLILD